MTNYTKRVKVVITGGAGFIGSHIADECVNRGWDVIVIDNLTSGKLENIQHLVGAHNLFEFIQGDITDLLLLRKIFTGVDYVFHQAAIASVPKSIQDPDKSNEVNITGTLDVLIAARDNKVKKVIFASSSAVYGDTPGEYKREDMPLDPQSPYAVTKLTGELYCQLFGKVYNLPTACLRYFNVYGPRQSPLSDYAAVIPKFIDRINSNEDIIIYGDGLQTRDFVAVQDVAKANVLAAESKTSGIFNIGTGEKVSLNKLVEILILLTGRTDLKAVNKDERLGDIKHSTADITMAKSIGYAPQYTLAEGLRQLLGKSLRKI